MLGASGAYRRSRPQGHGHAFDIRAFAERTQEREAAISLQRETPRAKRFEHDADETRLLAAAGPHLRGVLIALLDTECRLGEVLSLQWKNVSLERRELVVEARKSKTRTARILPLSTRLVTVLESRRLDPAGAPFGAEAYVFGNALGERTRSVREAWERCRRAGGAATPRSAARGRLSLR